jgi:hypothetical protein
MQNNSAAPSGNSPMYQRNGTSQAGRHMPALNPGYAPVDERSIADLVAFARQYARELRYFNEQNEAEGDWSAFLDGVDDLLDDLAASAQAQSDGSNRKISVPPHLALLLTFFHLLRHAQTQMNDLTRRHLEFFYREALRLTSRPPVPDHVHVLVELAAGQEQFRLPAGSQLYAGQDSQGIDRFYYTDEHMLASQASVANLKSLFVQKQVVGIREAHHNPDLLKGFPIYDAVLNSLEPDAMAFMAILSMALGESQSGELQPGGILPEYPGTDRPLNSTVLRDLDTLIAFIQSDLAMPLPVFRTLMQLKYQQDHADPEWGEINSILEKVGKKQVDDFQLDMSEPRNFEKNLLAALGLDNFDTFFDTLPEVETIYDLYRWRERPEVRAFIEQQLAMPFDDFTRMMQIVDNIYKNWRRIYDLLRTAARKKEPGRAFEPPMLRAYDPDKFQSLLDKTIGPLEFPMNLSSLDDCYAALLRLESYFHMPAEHFAVMRAIAVKATAAKPWEWEQVYALLAQAHTEKALPERWQVLENQHAAGGFEALIRFALGDPLPGDPLPDTKDFMALDATQDAQYIREQLYLEVANFEYIQNTEASSEKASKEDWKEDWAKVYKMLEVAQRRKRGWQAQAQIERWQNIYAAADAPRVQVRPGQSEEISMPRWRTFGANPEPHDPDYPLPAVSGLAIASPLLALAAGERTITLKLVFQDDHFSKETIEQALEHHPLQFFLSTATDMIAVSAETIQCDNLQDDGQADGGMLQVVLKLDAQAPPVEPLTVDGAIHTPWPMLHIRLVTVPATQDTAAQDNDLIYRAFQHLLLQQVHLAVEVAGITQLALQNDESVLDAKKPFLPFGAAPVVGSSFSFAHPELCSKQLDHMTLHIEWLGAPDNFAEYYRGYADYQNPTDPPASPVASNEDFKAQLRLYDNRAYFDIRQMPLFRTDPIAGTEIAKAYPGYQPDPRPATADEVLDWSRYWQLELLAPDFQHTIYPRAAAGYANRKKGNTADPYIVNPPYTPTIKRLVIDYGASTTIDPNEQDPASGNMLFHIEPFGYRPLAREANGQYFFLPQHTNEGELYIGIAGMNPPQQLALLFQMAEGSADPDVAYEPVHWHYLDANRWRSLEQGQLLSDTTNGLRNTGIITFELPAVLDSTRLPADCYWIRASIAKNSRSISDLVTIHTNAVRATFADQGNAPDHLSKPLLADSITRLAEPQPEVQAIHQPYSSFGGNGPEAASHFYTRVSERLRHKNRALTSWDYERLILEAFPEIYKVKCLPVGSSEDPRQSDQIQIIVIPDIRGKQPFDPFEPKVAADTLWAIENYLSQHVPASAQVVISNPQYLRLQVRLGVRFRPGTNPGYARQELNRDLQRYLAPWAYDQSADIVFGGRINASLIINFVEQRPSVDYVAGIKLFTRTHAAAEPQQVAQQFTVPANAILVSDREHQIDLIGEEVYQETYFTGINYMIIELDFQIA